MEKNKFLLFLIVLAQFCGTSVWFASNAIMPDLLVSFQLPSHSLGYLTSAIQFGFILGTFLFALFTVADRYSPSKVFFICALAASLFNLSTILQFNTLATLLASKTLIGICLAGIYPVGMKIAADHFKEGLGSSLGFLVGALVLGTSFPHFLHIFQGYIYWKEMLMIISGVTALGGIIIFLGVADGPYRKPASQFKLSAISEVFRPKKLRVAAIGYFGHMWELYTFWTFVPLLLLQYSLKRPSTEWNISLLSFLIIGIGSLGCIIAGRLSKHLTISKIAFSALSISALCCLLLPLGFYHFKEGPFLFLLLVWGLSVVADSPLFSTMIAQNSSPQLKGTALTLVNSIGFAITIVSIQLINYLSSTFNSPYVFMLLAIGPALGLFNYLKARKHF